MAEYDITFSLPNGGEVMQPVEAETVEMAVLKAALCTILELEEITENIGVLLGVRPLDSTKGFASALADGEVHMDIKEVVS